MSSKVGKSLQITIPSVGSKNVAVKVTVKDPSGKTYTIASADIAKNKPYATPILKFSKPGTYTASVLIGTAKKIVAVKVAK